MFEGVLNRWNIRRIEECQTLIEWLGPRIGQRILDVGCGEGFNEPSIARNGATVVGMDLSEPRLRLAARRNSGPRISFVLANGEILPFADEAFDKAVSFCVIEHFHDDGAVLTDLHRVLRPGGLLVLSADSLSNPEITAAERRWQRRRYAVNTLYTRATLRRKLEERDFVVERSRYILTTPVTLALVRLSWALDRLPRGLTGLKAVGYFLLGTAGMLVADIAEIMARRPHSGLTLLMQARRR